MDGRGNVRAELAHAKWRVLEPAWKAILASKKLLLVLQELYPDHPHLLPVSDQPLAGSYVAKPAFGREGAQVSLVINDEQVDKREGRADLGSFVYQQYCPLVQPRAGLFAQCGVWMAGPEPAGLGIREDSRPILGNTSRFVAACDSLKHMLAAYLTAHADFFFWTGIVVETVGGFWFLFDSYRCDVALARWTLLFPPIAIYLAFRYPEECLKSFIACVIGLVFITLGTTYAPAGEGGLIKLPDVLKSQLSQ